MTSPIIAGTEVRAMVDALAEHLGRSVVIDDPAVRLICASRHFGDEDDVRIRAVLQRDAGDEVGRFVLAQGAARWHGPHVLQGNAALGLKSRLCVPLYAPGWLIGLLMVIDAEQSLTPSEVERIEKVSRDIAAKMYADSLIADPHQLERQKSLRDLLGRDGAARETAIAFFDEHRDLQDAAHTAVTVVDVAALKKSDTPTDIALRLALDAAGRGRSRLSGLYIAGERATLLQLKDRPLAASELGDQARNIKSELHRLLGGTAATAIGIGTSTGGRSGAWLARRRAEIAVRAVTRIPNQTEGIAFWSELGVDAVLLDLPDDALVWSTVPEPVRRLVERDGAGKLLETLRCFLEHGGSISHTAAALHMHRTSLYYRLDQIRTITGVDLDDGRDRLVLHVGLHLLDLIPRPAD